MYPRSRSKAFRNAILWTWWLPLLLAAAGGGWWHYHHKNEPEEWVALGKIVVRLPGGQVPDEATMQAHVSLLESPTVAEQAEVHTRQTYPEVTLPMGHVKASSREGGLIHVVVTGPEERGTKIYLNECLEAYMATMEYIRRNGSPVGEKLNREAVPAILERAGFASEKPREFESSMSLMILGGGVGGLLLMLLISGLWALFCPASTQPSLNEIVKAATRLDATSHAVLVEWLRGRASREAHGEHTA